MSLHFVLGKAKSGKSRLCYDMVFEHEIQPPKGRYIFIAPEQMTFYVQRELINAHPGHSLLGTEVLSFQRLAYRIFEDSRMLPIPVIDEAAKSMILKKTLLDVNDQLIIYKGSCKSRGFLEKLKIMLSELVQYELDTDKLCALSEKDGISSELSCKLHDLYIINKRFRELMLNRYILPEDIYASLAACIKTSGFVKDSTVILDGFHDFTLAQHSVMTELFCACRDVYVVLNMSADELCKKRNENSLFSLPRMFMEELSDNAQKAGANVCKPEWTKKTWYDSEEISFLESSYEQKNGVFTKKTSDIFLITASDPSGEVSAVCSKMLEFTRDLGMRFGDMAVVSSNLSAYQGLFEKYFTQAGIPYFCDMRHSLKENAGADSILSALFAVAEGFSYESVFRYLKSGLFIDQSKVDLCENYCLAAGIKGVTGFKKEWNRRVRDFSEEETAAINDIKNELLGPLFSLRDNMKSGAQASKKVAAVRRWLEDVDMEKHLEELSQELLKTGNQDRAQEYSQVFSYTDQVLSRCEEMLGDEKLSLAEFYEIMESGFEEISAGVVPLTMDGVVIADMKRSRLRDVKAVFIVGMNEGTFPGTVADCGLLSDPDREKLIEQGIKLAPTARKESFFDKYHIYRVMAKPSAKLCLSYSRQSQDKKALRPSYIVNQIRRIFPNMTCIEASDEIYQADQGLYLLASGKAGDADAVRDFYKAMPEYSRFIDMIDSASGIRHKPEKISVQSALDLFKKTESTSVTHLEQYASCRWAYFLRYGLGIYDRQEHGVRSMDLGNIFHDALDHIFKTIKQKGLAFENIDDSKIKELTGDACDFALLRYSQGKFGSEMFDEDPRFIHIAGRIRDILEINMKAIVLQMNAGSYKSKYTELEFGGAQSLYGPIKFDDSGLSLLGKVDRIDEADDGKERFVRVIDYKTGNTKFDFTKLYYGLSLQLMLYLSAVLRMNKGRLPGGAFYYHVADPFAEVTSVETAGMEDEAIRDLAMEKRMNALRLDGVLNSSGGSLEAFEKKLDADKTSKVLQGLSRNKDGSLSATSPAYSAEILNDMMNLSWERAADLSKHMLEGDVDTNPYIYENKKPCTYCDYSQACPFCPDFPGYVYRRLKKQSVLDWEEKNGSKMDRKPAENN